MSSQKREEISVDRDEAKTSTSTQDACPTDKKPNCHKASKHELRKGGIKDEHAYKAEHRALPLSRFDICKCSDGSFRIAPVGKCGKTNFFWD